MLDLINNFITRIMDYVLFWILYLPRDLKLAIVAVMTGFTMTLIRKWTTDQEWLKRAWQDQQRLNQLKKQAKLAGDKEAKTRYVATETRIKVKSLKFEFKPLAYAVIPVALLATWCFGRLGFAPPQPGETVQVKMYLKASAIGSKLPHLAAPPGVQLKSPPIQNVVKDSFPPPLGPWDKATDWLAAQVRRPFAAWGMADKDPAARLEGVAVWDVQAEQPGEYALQFRCDGKTYAKQFLVGGRTYAQAFDAHDGQPVQGIELVMKPLRLFDFVGSLTQWLPGWLVAYLLIAIPFMSISKRILRVY